MSKFTNRARSRLCKRLSGETNSEATRRPAQRKRLGLWSMGTEREGGREREKRDRKKTRCKMSSLLADVCWSNSKIQTSLVILVSTDLNLYAHTHCPISRRGQTSYLCRKLPGNNSCILFHVFLSLFRHPSLIL